VQQAGAQARWLFLPTPSSATCLSIFAAETAARRCRSVRTGLLLRADAGNVLLSRARFSRQFTTEVAAACQRRCTASWNAGVRKCRQQRYEDMFEAGVSAVCRYARATARYAMFSEGWWRYVFRNAAAADRCVEPAEPRHLTTFIQQRGARCWRIVQRRRFCCLQRSAMSFDAAAFRAATPFRGRETAPGRRA